MGENRLSILLQLFTAFCRIGPATFGGGYAMLPLIEHEAVQKRKWLDEREMSDLLSIAGSAPGGVGVNASAFIGYRLAGIAGAIAAVAGITLPTFAFVSVLSGVYFLIQDSPKAEAAMLGVHSAILALIAVSAYKMARTSLFDRFTVMLAVSTLAILLATGLHPIVAIAAGILLGIGYVGIKSLRGLAVITEKQPRPGGTSDGVYLEYYI